MGLITVMYWAEFGYTNGFSAMTIGVIAFVTTLFVGLTGFMVSGLRASGATTVAEYYEIRYGRGVRILGGIIIAVAGILNYGVFLQVEARLVVLFGAALRVVFLQVEARLVVLFGAAFLAVFFQV